jgi:hypothetical protein
MTMLKDGRVVVLLALVAAADAFAFPITLASSSLASSSSSSASSSSSSSSPWSSRGAAPVGKWCLQADGTGGWGIGNSREMVPEEFSKGDRRAFEGYKLRDRGEFMRQVRKDKDEMVKGEVDELLGVAKLAGLTVKDPSERLNKFGDDILLLEADDDDLDVSVSWGDGEPEPSAMKRGVDDSITRLDEDTGTLGVW